MSAHEIPMSISIDDRAQVTTGMEGKALTGKRREERVSEGR